MMGVSGVSTSESPVLLLRHDGAGAGPLGATLAEALTQKGSRCAEVVVSGGDPSRGSLLADLECAAADIGGAAAVVIDPGTGKFAPAAGEDVERYRELAREPLAFVFAALQAGRDLLEPTGGTLLLLTSTASWTGLPYASATSVLHAGVENLVKTLAVEWASFGLRVVGVAAGALDLGDGEEHPMAGVAPLGRGDAGDIAAAVRFLISPGARFITGATLVVDGGLSCRTL